MKPCFCACFPQILRYYINVTGLVCPGPYPLHVCYDPSTYYVHLLNILSLACGQKLQWLSWVLIGATEQPAETSSRIGLGGPRISLAVKKGPLYRGLFIAVTASDTWLRQKRTQDRGWIGKALLLSLSLSYASCLFLFPFKASFTS